MVSNFTIFFIFSRLIFKLFFTNITDFWVLYDSFCPFINNFIFFFLKLIIFIACSFKDSQNFFMQSLPLHTSRLFSMSLNDDIVDIEKPDGIGSLTSFFLIFQDYFYIPSIFSNKDFNICINNEWCFIRFMILIKF